jgi:hypothetical protein
MSMLDGLMQNGAVEAISREMGVDQQTAQSGLTALLPAVTGGMQNQAQAQPQGLGGLAGMLGGLGGGGLLDNVLGPQPTDTGQGNAVLGQIFGSKDTSRAVADHASQQSGLSPDLLKRMLPIVAMLAAGYFAKQAHGRAGTPDESGLGGLLGGMGGGGMGGVLGSILGGAGGGGGGAGALGGILGGLMGGKR